MFLINCYKNIEPGCIDSNFVDIIIIIIEFFIKNILIVIKRINVRGLGTFWESVVQRASQAIFFENALVVSVMALRFAVGVSGGNAQPGWMTWKPASMQRRVFSTTCSMVLNINGCTGHDVADQDDLSVDLLHPEVRIHLLLGRQDFSSRLSHERQVVGGIPADVQGCAHPRRLYRLDLGLQIG